MDGQPNNQPQIEEQSNARIGEDDQQQQAQQAQAGRLPHQSPSLEKSSSKLYVGNLSPQVSEALVYDLFSTLGQVQQVKLIRDRVTGQSIGYGFVDYVSAESATMAIQSMKGMRVLGRELDVNRAHRNTTREHTANHFHLFVGDLAGDVDDMNLFNIFSKIGDCTDARVMWDPSSHRSRGYGFVSFRVQQDAEKAIREMNGQFVGSRPVRVNWAAQRQPAIHYARNVMMMPPHAAPQAVAQRTVYIGNIGPEVTQHMLTAKLQEVAPVQEMRFTPEKGYAFVGLQSHEEAVRIIQRLNGLQLGSKPLKVAWGKRDGNAASPRFPYPQQFPYPYNFPANPYFQMGNMAGHPNLAGFAGPSSFVPSSLSPSGPANNPINM